MVFFSFIVIGIVIYIMRNENLKRKEKREIFKIQQQGKFEELLKKAREEDKNAVEENDK